MQSTHLLLSQKQLEKLFQEAPNQDFKLAIMEIWEAGKDLDLSSTAVVVSTTGAVNEDPNNILGKYYAKGYKAAIEHILAPENRKS